MGFRFLSVVVLAGALAGAQIADPTHPTAPEDGNSSPAPVALSREQIQEMIRKVADNDDANDRRDGPPHEQWSRCRDRRCRDLGWRDGVSRD